MTQRQKLSRCAPLAALVIAGTVGCAGPSLAATYTATELSYDSALLSQFNLINIGALNVGTTNGNAVYTAGRVLAGSVTTGANGLGTCLGTNLGASGNSGSSVACTGNTSNVGSGNTTTTGATTLSGTAYGALTVFGNVVGAVGATGGGTVYVGGNVSGNAAATSGTSGRNGTISGANSDNVNVVGTLSSTTTAQDTPKYTTSQTSTSRGGTLTNVTATSYGNTAASVFPFGSTSTETTNFQTPLKNLYSGLANLPGSPGVTAQSLPSNQTSLFTSNTAYTTTVNGTTYKYGVVTTTLANLSAEGASFGGIANGSGNNATFVIVTGDGAGSPLPTLNYNDSKVIYDFVGATSLALASNFNASILAPLANLNAGTNTINGTVVVASMTANNNLYNGNAFTGDLTGLTNFSYNARVPEPMSLSLLGVGVAAAAIARRRRK